MPLDGGETPVGERFNQLCQAQGWSHSTLLDLALSFLEKASMFDVFVESLEEQAAEEQAAAGRVPLTENERWTLIHSLAVAADEYQRLAGPRADRLSAQFERQARAARAMAARIEAAAAIEVTA